MSEGDFNIPARNVRSEAHLELKAANVAYTECVSKQFMPRWFKGEDVQVNDVCGSLYEDMMEKNAGIYGEQPLPFQTLKLPEAQL